MSLRDLSEATTTEGCSLFKPSHSHLGWSHLPSCKTFFQDAKKVQSYWGTEICKRRLECLKAVALTEMRSSQERGAGLAVHWPWLFMSQVPQINLSTLCFMAEQPPPISTFESEAQMTAGSSAHRIFSLNFNLDNSNNKLSGSSYKWYWLWRLFFPPGWNKG